MRELWKHIGVLVLFLACGISSAQQLADDAGDRMGALSIAAVDSAQPLSAQELFALGREQESAGNLKEAYRLYREAYWRDTTSFRSLYRGGRVLLKYDELEFAHAAFLRAIALQPDFYPAYNSLGLTLSLKHNPRAAYNAFLDGAQVAPQYAQAWRNVGKASAVIGEYDWTLKAYEKAVELVPDDVDARVTLGLLYAWYWKTEAARSQFEAALELQPDNPRAAAGLKWVDEYGGRGVSEMAETGMTQRSATGELVTDEVSMTRELPPEPEPPRTTKRRDWAFSPPEPPLAYSEAYQRRGIALVELGRYEEAVEQLETAQEHGAVDDRVYSALGYALHQIGEDDKAAEAYRQAIDHAIEPMPWYHINRGAVLQSAGRLGAAAKEYRKAIKLDETSARAYFALGLLRLDQGHNRDALSALTKAVKYGEHYGPAHAALGVALIRSDRRGDALLAYENAVRLMPDDPDARMSLARLLEEQGRVLEAAEQYLEFARIAEGLPGMAEWRLVAMKRARDLAGMEVEQHPENAAASSMMETTAPSGP